MLGNALKLRRDPLGYLEMASQAGGDVVPISIGPETLYLLNHPDHIRHVFIGNEKNFVKGRYYRRITPFTGGGIFTQEGIEWSRQRHIAQPFFAGEILNNFAGIIAGASQNSIRSLQGYFDKEKVQKHDLLTFFSAITLSVAIECFSGPQIEFPVAARLAHTLTRILRYLEKRLWHPLPLPGWLPTTHNKRFQRDVSVFYDFVNSQIAGRLRGEGNRPGELLVDAIIAAEGTHPDRPGQYRIVSEQILSIILAAFETGALALVWATILLQDNPHMVERIRDEADRVLQTNDVTVDQVSELSVSRSVFMEALRLYPPAWCFSRELVANDQFGETKVRGGKTVIISPYLFHRSPDLWDRPLEFDPDRFTPDLISRRHRYAYFPFAGGRHACLGARFAMIEGPLILSILLKSFDLHFESMKKIKPVAMTTLRPGVVIPMSMSPRK